MISVFADENKHHIFLGQMSNVQGSSHVTPSVVLVVLELDSQFMDDEKSWFLVLDRIISAQTSANHHVYQLYPNTIDGE